MATTLKTIDERLQGIEDALIGGVKYVAKWPLWTKIVAGVGLVLLVILLITVFRKKPEVNQDYLKEIKALDEKIELQQQTIEALQSSQAFRDSLIIEQLDAISKNKTTQTQIIHRYEKIPTDVRSLDRDKLRSEITNY